MHRCNRISSTAPKGTLFEPVLFFLCQKEKNGFNLPRKERGQSSNRSPKIFSEDFSLYPSVASIPTVRKSATLCSRLSETPSCISDFHTQQVPRARPLVARRGVGKPFERFPHALFSFGGSTPFPFLKEKRKWGRNLPFSEKRQKEWGRKSAFTVRKRNEEHLLYIL